MRSRIKNKMNKKIKLNLLSKISMILRVNITQIKNQLEYVKQLKN